MRGAVTHAILFATAAARPWSPAAISDYVRERAGGPRAGGGVFWVGEGTLRRASGRRIAALDCVESAERECSDGEAGPEAPGGAFSVRRLIVYRDPSGNGTLLHVPDGRAQKPVPPLEYTHVVRIGASSASPEPAVSAARADGSEVATGRTLRSGLRQRPLSRVFTLDVQAEAPRRGRGSRSKAEAIGRSGDAAAALLTGSSGAGVPGTIEEYELRVPRWPGSSPLLGRELLYRRTGPCPSWCGAGVCTTELRLRRCRPPLAKRTLARLLRDCLDTDGRASREQE
mmetsp:Transcript_52019/g.167759  ORF Transcript_52019/g.167759 Transcript_52019/m.167759 type:complete len:285 (-) Transcript_52019:74-928(-)